MKTADGDVHLDFHTALLDIDESLHDKDVEEALEEEACHLLLQVPVPLCREERLLLFLHVQLQEEAWSLNKLVSLILGSTLDDLTVFFEVAVLQIVGTIVVERVIK